MRSKERNVMESDIMNPPGSSGLLSSGPWNHVEAHDTAENHNTRSGDVGKRLPGHEYFEDVNGFWHVGLWHIFPNGEQILMGVKAKVSQLDGSIALGGYYRGEPGSDPDKTQHPLFRIVPEMNVQQVLLPFEVSKAAGEGVIDKSISIRAYLMYIA
ncbi:hypothetical protein M7I_5146 [Glarea lozoyensis 74030]|uniref:Uncharacterized protein n=1 Tax=Glarea lozoyensis (strain ATCC 74030 / MF5533) TaxID=1104152 RepID=H0ER31_GLAL7|nr:hypothetical protein M7I_5146 [Glarea lozoyensis 74030]